MGDPGTWETRGTGDTGMGRRGETARVIFHLSFRICHFFHFYRVEVVLGAAEHMTKMVNEK